MNNNENNLDLIIQTALNLLDLPINKSNMDMLGFIHHPFFNSIFIPYKDEFIDIRKDTSKFKNCVNELKEHIKSENSVSDIMLHITQPYQLLFFSLIEDYLDEQTFATLLKECYTKTEFPNCDVNVPVEDIREMFKTANKTLLMDADEVEIFNKLDNELTIYRGFYSNEYYDALSWTLDYDKAHFFARRFNNTKGSIFQANIKKDDIYAYFECRNEKEIIVDYTKLYNITKKVQFD